MQVTYAHLCDRASIGPTRKVDLTGIFDSIATPSLPVKLPEAWLAFEIKLDWTEVGHPFKARVDCVDADGHPLFRATATLKVEGKAVPGESRSLGQVLRLPDLVFVRAGRHEINIFLGSEAGARYHVPFDVIKVTPPASPSS